MTNLSWLPYPGSPTQWFSQRWPQTTTNGASQPAFLLQPLGTTPGTWSTSGTGIGINAPATFAGNLLDLQQAGSRLFAVTRTSATGAITTLAPVFSGGGVVGEAQWISTPYAHTLFLATYGGGYNLTITNQDTNSSVILNTNGYFEVGTVTPRPRIQADAANVLALRNGTNAQTFRVYNTYSSTTNYERAKLEWSSNALKVGTEKGSGGGTARSMSLQTDATDRLTITAVGTAVINTGFTVATLPGTPTTGEIARVTDASAPAVGSTVVGGGAAFALVVYNGANWNVFAI